MVGAATGDKVFIYGGLKSSEFRSLGLFFSFDPGANSWTRLPSNAVPLHHAAPAAVDGKFYLFSGFDFTRPQGQPVGWLPVASGSVFDPATGRWDSLPDMPSARGAAVAVAAGDKIHVIGGAIEPHTHGERKGLSISGPVGQSRCSIRERTAGPSGRRFLPDAIITAPL
jgi:N-acetylneuraminic acid mutarotase